MVYRYRKKELLQKSAFLATKMNTNDKTHENPDKTVWSMAHIANLYRNCSESPRFRRQKYRQNLPAHIEQTMVYRYRKKELR